MRKILLFIAVFIVGCGVAYWLICPDERPLAQKFAERMNYVRFDTYIDPDFGYAFDYPSFFERDETEDFGCGHVQFSYHTNTNIIIECRVVPERVYTRKKSDFIESGPLKELDNYYHYTHFIRHQHRWYILALYYPADYTAGVKRIKDRIENWNLHPRVYNLGLTAKDSV